MHTNRAISARLAIGTETAVKCKNKMRYQILVLACWLWIVTNSKSDLPDECVRDFQGYGMITESDTLIEFYDHEGYINLICDWLICNISIVNISCIPGEPTPCTQKESEPTSKPTPCIPSESLCECTPPISENTTSKVTSAAVNDKHSTSNSTIVAALGALVGVLLVLLATVSVVLAWTCWLLKKWNGMKFNSEYQLRSNTDHGQLVNPTYEGDDLLHLQPEQPVPAYETIAPHPRDGARLEFLEQGENGYHILSREQRPNPETATATTTQHMEMILEDSREESYSKLESREGSGSSKKTNEEDNIGEYSKLEIVNIGSNAPTDSTRKVSDATIESNDDSSEETEGKVLRIMDNKAFDDNGDDLQLENDDTEKEKEEAKRELPAITITLDEDNTRKDSTDPETSTTEDGACA